MLSSSLLSFNYYAPNLSVYLDDFKIENYSGSTGLKTIDENSYIIYPNPVSRSLYFRQNYLSGGEVNIEIYDALGALVHTETISHAQQEMNVDNLKTGLYQVVFRTLNKIEKHKLVIQK
ncbi:MAG: T9SS type A sorting domain-containing protein [bacterium]|nr:T9SS type A sorting domain-containing protein [bacterium]